MSCPDPANNIATSPGGHYYDCMDGTVVDTKTGLMWEKKDNNCAPSSSPNHDAANELHCVTNVYSWSLAASIQRDGTLWTDFLARLNLELSAESTAAESTCFANHCDWRIPNIQELASLRLANYPATCPLTGCIDPVFDPVYWPGTSFVNDFYSSSADGTYGYSATGAWGVNFNNGSHSNDGKQGPYLARAVRGGR